MTWTGELEPIAIQQIHKGQTGKAIEVDQDVLGVVKQLKQIDPTLYVRWSEKGEYFVVYCRLPDEPPGTGNVVLMVRELDQRVVSSIQKAKWEQQQDGYSLADILDKKDDDAKKQRDYEFSQQIGERAERLAHAIRKDFHFDQNRVAIPKDVPTLEIAKDLKGIKK